MQRPAIPQNEQQRLAAVQALGILDTGPESTFDDLVAIAAAVCGVPMGAVSLIDAERQWFKAHHGLEVAETPRELSFCGHAILGGGVFVVPDALEDARFRDNPFVTGEPGVRFYAGAPLLDADGLAVGALCVMDRVPRRLAVYQLQALEALSRQVSAQLELRRVTRELQLQLQERHWYEAQLRSLNAELALRNADLGEQVLQDALTGLANRRALGAALERAIADGGRYCLALLDIDHFKAVNDTHGHVAGDEVLVAVARALASSADGDGVLARYGGEEFAWLLDGGIEAARLRCEDMRRAAAMASPQMPVTASIGLTAVRPGDGLAGVMQRADRALYAAKRGGRDRVEIA
ncbi:sensor domain-containing diguanylate cyclase [uncultured Luteimonas sp.]|uniref:GGDEF domain-containing protein n=1 Tax=uncultured Luteimonas sp. TaxID=453144 RepID=UPI002623F49A|nr:sensor domain-containing diguanylate cyclase [uncultured Luteimonas sp.]